MAELIVTIDGPAGSGKSTMARLLAQKLKARFLDTGAMYRAVTLAAMQAGINLESQRELLEIIQKNDFDFSIINDNTKVYINGIDMTEQIRDPEVTSNARHIASAPNVRDKLVQMQRQFAAEQEKIVTEGRDQGTVAFPEAQIKFFLTAEPAERARRRQIDLQAKGINDSLVQIQKAIEQRDKSDRDRAVGPLKPADDAIVVDTTGMTIEQSANRLFEYVKEKCLKKN